MYPPNVNTNETEVVERLIAAKFQPTGVDTFNIYVDSVSGNDQSPGTGDSTSPYLTIHRAICDIHKFGLLEVARIILSGASDHELSDGYIFPAMVNADLQGTEVAQTLGMRATGPLIIQAAPVSALAIPAINMISQAPDATSGLRPLVTDIALVANAHNGRWIVDANGVIARILSNDATTFLIANSTALVGPCTVYRAGATIAPDVPGSTSPTMYFRGSAMVLLQGVIVEASAGGALKVDRGQELVAIACQLDKVVVGEDDAQSPGFLNAQGCLMGDYELNAGGLKLSRCVSDDDIVGGAVSGFLRAMVTDSSQCYFNDMSGRLWSDGTFSTLVNSFQNCEVLLAPAVGIEQIGGQVYCSAVKVSGGGTCGVRLVINAAAVLDNMSGLNGTNGLVCQSGGTAVVTSTCLLTAAASADFLVDGLPAMSAANFQAMVAPISLKGPLSGIIRSSDTGFRRNGAAILTTTPLTLSNAHEFVFEDATAGAKVLNLPVLATARGKAFFLSKSDTSANTVTVTPNGAETIDGAASVVLASQFQSLWLVAPDTGTAWKVLLTGIPSAGGQVVIPAGLKAHDLQKAFADTGYTALITDYIIAWTTAGGACIQNLPALAGVRGSVFKIAKKTTDGNAVTITPNGAETIGTAATLVLAGGAVRAAELYAPLAGTDWLIL